MRLPYIRMPASWDTVLPAGRTVRFREHTKEDRMEAYIGTKIVKAESMEHHAAVLAGFARGTPVIEGDGHSEAGYKVVYEDGYTSWSPKETFERAYRRVTAAEQALLV